MTDSVTCHCNTLEFWVFTEVFVNKKARYFNGLKYIGGEGEIRTHGGLAPSTVFKTAALNRSATSPISNAVYEECFIQNFYKGQDVFLFFYKKIYFLLQTLKKYSISTLQFKLCAYEYNYEMCQFLERLQEIEGAGDSR